MCGIAGILSAKRPIDPTLLANLTLRLKHRGPDDCGTSWNKAGTVGFAHTRLSILDVSPSGHQPMFSEDKRFVVVFNGEIYNFRKLKEEMISQGCQFQSDCDTEVLLKLYAQNAPNAEKMLDRLEGMFAFAIWDEQEQSCFFARDPFGIKPLYYWRVSDQLAFASEMRTLLSSELEPKIVSSESIVKLLMFGSTPAPETLIQNIHTLPAGHWMKWKDGNIEVQRYWKPQFVHTEMTQSDAVRLTRNALQESVCRHFVSDVPVGIFLSGGKDSTALVALARSAGFKDIKTFSISFNEKDFNEGDIARRTAKHFGTEHHDQLITAADGEKLIDEFHSRTDQPGNDGFNTFCVSKFARENGMKVVLSGLGGDELFGGYQSFRTSPKLLRLDGLLRYSRSLRKLVASVLTMTGEHRARRLAVLLNGEYGPLAAYWAMRGFFTPDEAIKLCGQIVGQEVQMARESLFDCDIDEQATTRDLVSYFEVTRYMLNQLLKDSDVFSMANGLELRVPFVDRKFFDAISLIPAAIRLANGKRLLVQAVPELPDWVINAPKRGFSFPFSEWMGDNWREQFDAVQRTTDIRMNTWYRSWTVLTLKKFLESNLGEQSVPWIDRAELIGALPKTV